MPLDVRPIAIKIAVICFFALSLIGWANGISPLTCCKRAATGAVIAYITAVCAVKAVNAILTSAMITSRMNQQQQKDSSDDSQKD